MMNGNLFVFSELFYPDESATGYFLTRIAEGCARSYHVHVLCAPSNVNASGSQAHPYEERKGVVIERCAATTFNKNNVFLRFINLLTVSISILLKALWRVRPGDSVLVVTNPPTLPFIAWAVCRLRKGKCLLLIHDVFPEALTAARMLRPNGVLDRFLGWLYIHLYRSVAKIIVLGRDMHKLVAQKLEPDDSRVAIITNWADLDHVVPLDRGQNHLLQKLHLTRKFVFQYSGNIGRMHGLETLLDAAKSFQNQEDIHFLLIGSGAKKQWLESIVMKSDLRNVSLLPLQPRKELCDVLNACDVAVISFIPGMAGVSVPSKMYNIMAAGKPIIALVDSDSEVALVIQEERIGWVVPPERPDVLADVIREAKANPRCLIDMRKRARAAVERRYSFERIMQQYQELLEEVTGVVGS